MVEELKRIPAHSTGGWYTLDSEDREHTHGVFPSSCSVASGGFSWECHGKYHREQGRVIENPPSRLWMLNEQELYGRILLW